MEIKVGQVWQNDKDEKLIKAAIENQNHTIFHIPKILIYLNFAKKEYITLFFYSQEFSTKNF